MTAFDCPDPATCPVPNPGTRDSRRLQTFGIPAGTTFYTVYGSGYWPSVFNDSGLGDTRFSPLRDNHNTVIPTLYGGATRTVALLETAFHEVHAAGARIISEAIDLRRRGIVTLHAPARLPLIDLRDAGLARLGLDRAQLVATLPNHYRCTREWGTMLASRDRIGRAVPVGLLWNSRIAELAQADSRLFDDLLSGYPSEVFVLFGNKLPIEVREYGPVDRHDDLTSGIARDLVDQIANQLGATIMA